jgi:hypothetical protein
MMFTELQARVARQSGQLQHSEGLLLLVGFDGADSTCCEVWAHPQLSTGAWPPILSPPRVTRLTGPSHQVWGLRYLSSDYHVSKSIAPKYLMGPIRTLLLEIHRIGGSQEPLCLSERPEHANTIRLRRPKKHR